ncbi:vesicle transport v-snare protein, putative [Ichthyophthirius multifiliis]|uniref:Vesicle transport v-snare protein, putative n=1 Tax=Ichthyophthirius multifiliis TaxID=5932 RepID=G0QLL0_ICHMU|nr:vesicle transport v-snare protein, putative [Ichthyophthirius multifiliis]EGR33894.1 vesicle transport v-snare protein, putative [Ichthyophthirius multifiliis]|eukprot:XP_004039118.1 vesicle transport v-snare protein, putative [Ichthyophthirius multifiliis]
MQRIRKKLQYNKDYIELMGNTQINNQKNEIYQKLNNQNQKLIEAKKNMYDLEGQSENIQAELKRQNDKLDKLNKDTLEIDSDLGAAHQLVNRIHSNIIKNKRILYIIIGILFLATLYIVYSWF